MLPARFLTIITAIALTVPLLTGGARATELDGNHASQSHLSC
jgi:hypothetical protein